MIVSESLVTVLVLHFFLLVEAQESKLVYAQCILVCKEKLSIYVCHCGNHEIQNCPVLTNKIKSQINILYPALPSTTTYYKFS